MKLRSSCLRTVFIALTVTLFSQAANAQDQVLFEGLESGNKDYYAGDSVELTSGLWYLDDALIGNLSGDRRNGSWSARVRNDGSLTMEFDLLNGAGTVTVLHARYGSDASTSWELRYSTDSGSSWTKFGSTVNTISTSLHPAIFTVNISSPIRFQIYKTSGGPARLNIDDITVLENLPPPFTESVHLTMGNPSLATPSTGNPNNYLMEKYQYVLSYSRENGTPNWVSWHLNYSWLGDVSRQNNFRSDKTLPEGWYRVTTRDYTGTGFDRGHMCPSADRTLTEEDNSATFLMTNIIPQMPDNNRGPWEGLESYCRTLVREGNELYIISGGYDTISYFSVSGIERILVPGYTWKVIIVLAEGDDDVARVDSFTRTIAVIMPNSGSIINNWRLYRVSVDDVEGATGFDFFSNVPTDIQGEIESRVDDR